jgi:hypothetical protein
VHPAENPTRPGDNIHLYQAVMGGIVVAQLLLF